MNKSLDIINRTYKPFKISKMNNCQILYTMDKTICLKESKINYLELYTYLKSHNFSNIPKLIDNCRKNYIITEYIENIENNPEQKANELIKLVSLLHAKTSYFKEISPDKYKEIYEKIKNRAIYIKNIYNKKFDNAIKKELYTPSEYLFLRNFSLINNACNYSLTKIEEWYSQIKDKTKERVALIHNNLSLNHFIKNDKDYLISWDKYTFDSPIIDLYKFYQKEWQYIPFKELLIEYNKEFKLNDDEKKLLDILISLPYEIEGTKEINECREYRKLINYLTKSSKIVIS